MLVLIGLGLLITAYAVVERIRAASRKRRIVARILGQD